MNEREVNEFLYKGADDLWAYVLIPDLMGLF